MNEVDRGGDRGLSEFARRTLTVLAIASLFVAVGAAFTITYDVFFLFFAGVLLAILLRSAARRLASAAGLGDGWALGIVVLVLAALLGGGLYFVGSTAAAQADQLATEVPQALDKAREDLKQSSWGRTVLRHAPTPQSLFAGNAASRLNAFFSTTFGILTNILVLLAVGIYLAAAPERHVRGTVKLVSPPQRPRAEEVMHAIGSKLEGWLIGRLAAMIVVGALTGLGLWLLGVDYALVLAVIAGVLTAVPYVGPIAAAIPAILVALMQSGSLALWVLGLYWAVQLVENYLVTPLAQQRAADLPPVVSIMSVMLLGALFGVLALIVATPLAVAVLTAVRMLYIEDVLGDRSAAEDQG
jgi:predicted PurR-regulated permease PerM